MSTFSSTVNSGASYLIRDFWQPFLRPRSDERHLVRASYAATILIVIAGVLIGYQARSIAQIWEWLMTALTACVVIPNVLRWYWWRMNGWGYAAGTLVGMAAAFVPPIIAPGAPMYVVFPFVTLYSLVASVAATLMTRPVDDDPQDLLHQRPPLRLLAPHPQRVWTLRRATGGSLKVRGLRSSIPSSVCSPLPAATSSPCSSLATGIGRRRSVWPSPQVRSLHCTSPGTAFAEIRRIARIRFGAFNPLKTISYKGHRLHFGPPPECAGHFACREGNLSRKSASR